MPVSDYFINIGRNIVIFHLAASCILARYIAPDKKPSLFRAENGLRIDFVVSLLRAKQRLIILDR